MRPFLLSIAFWFVGCSNASAPTETSKSAQAPQPPNEPRAAASADDSAAWKRCAGALRTVGQTAAADRADQYASALAMHPYQGGPGSEASNATTFVRNSAHQLAVTTLASVSPKPSDCRGLQ